MQMLVSAWNSVSTETIANCFREAGISPAKNSFTWRRWFSQRFLGWDWCLAKFATRSCTRGCQCIVMNWCWLLKVQLCKYHLQIPSFGWIFRSWWQWQWRWGHNRCQRWPWRRTSEIVLGKRTSWMHLSFFKSSLFYANGEAVQLNCLNIDWNIDNYFMKRKKTNYNWRFF